MKDITPTLLDLAGVAHPDTYKGRKVAALQGHSWSGLLEGRVAEARPATEAVGWELFFRRGLRQGDWKAVFLPRTNGPAYAQPNGVVGDWELFNLRTDPAEAHNIAAQEPERLKALIAAWDAYARDNGVVTPPPVQAQGEPQKVAAR